MPASFLRLEDVGAFQTAPLADKIKRIATPDPTRLDHAALAAQCRCCVKTNYQPASTARMGADGDPMAALDSRLRVRGIQGLRVADTSAVPDISAGNTNAPAMMLGDRCAEFVIGGH